jgi:hypothetical protein
MSVATPFATLTRFPFCVLDPQPSDSGFSYVSNVTPTLACALAWNLETLTFTTNGGATKGAATVSGSGTMTASVSGVSNTMPLFDKIRGSGMGVNQFDYGPFASALGIKQPRERICPSFIDEDLLFYEFYKSPLPSSSFGFFGFWLRNDPVNAGNYRVYYSIGFAFTAVSGGDIASVAFGDPNTVTPPTLWQSGTISISGISFPWISTYNTGAVTSGTGLLTASSGNFNYP